MASAHGGLFKCLPRKRFATLERLVLLRL